MTERVRYILLRPVVAAAAVAVVIVLPLLFVGEISDNEARAQARAEMYAEGARAADEGIASIERYFELVERGLIANAAGDVRSALATRDPDALFRAADRAVTSASVAGPEGRTLRQFRPNPVEVFRVSITDATGALLMEMPRACIRRLQGRLIDRSCDATEFATRVRGQSDPRAVALLASKDPSSRSRLSDPFVANEQGGGGPAVTVAAIVTPDDGNLSVVGMLLVDVSVTDALSPAIARLASRAEDAYVIDRTGRFLLATRDLSVPSLADLMGKALVAKAIRSQPVLTAANGPLLLREDMPDPFTGVTRPFATAVMTNLRQGMHSSSDGYGWQVLVVPDQTPVRNVEATLMQLRLARLALGVVLILGAFLLASALRAVSRQRGALALSNAGLKDALEQQTATADLLKVISRSAADAAPVFQAIVGSAVQLCRADHAGVWIRVENGLRVVATTGTWAGDPVGTTISLEPRRGGGSVVGRAINQRRSIHIADILEDPFLGRVKGVEANRTRLAVPILKDGEALGAIRVGRNDVRAFDEREIALVESFAAQAAIAIENVRLFSATKEALAQQTAISELVEIINSSGFDLQSVFDQILERAMRSCAAEVGWLNLKEPDGEHVRIAAIAAPVDEFTELGSGRSVGKLLPRGATGFSRREVTTRALAGELVHLPDITADPETFEASTTVRRVDGRGVLALPMLKAGDTVGAIVLIRKAARAFSESEIQLVRTFADHAVIAIESARLFNEVQNKSRELAAASRHKSEFLANMSHELRTPLNAVIGFSDVLEQGMVGPLNEKQSEYVRDISTSGKHLLDLVNEILDLSKVEAGRMELEPSEFAVSDAVLSTFNFVRERAAKHGIELAADVPADLGTITADERKVRQVLLNLLSNAVKFTPDGGWIGVTARRQDGEVRVSVKDTGIGIAPEDQPKVFEEFQQVGKASDRSREGTGLGLTLAKRFIELHGGRIWLESEVGRGTTFTFALPAERPVPVSATA